MPRATIRCDGNLRLRSLFDSIFLTSVTVAEGPALSLSTTTTEGSKVYYAVDQQGIATKYCEDAYMQ